MKAYRIIVEVSAIVILVSFSSCKDESNITTHNTIDDSYYPSKIGNEWYYTILGSLDTEPWVKKTIQEEPRINGKTYLVTNEVYGYYLTNPLRSYKDTIRIEKESKVIRSRNGVEYTWFDFTLKDGQTYQCPTFDSRNRTCQVTVKRFDTFTVKNKIYKDCIQFYFDIPISFDDENWCTFAKGIGLIEHAYMEGATKQLTSYSLSK